MRACAADNPMRVQRYLRQCAARLREPAAGVRPVRFGVDLGTATIVIAAVDARGLPAYWDFVAATVVRDGVVVDFQGAVQAVRELKGSAESALGCTIDAACTAHPPAVPASECRACAFVLQESGIDCRNLVDEVRAANAVLRVRDGAVVDVGGGSTGVGIYSDGERHRASDFAGGGYHLDLILAGALGLSVDEAERYKREHGAEAMQWLRPGFERIAEGIRRQCWGRNPGTVHLAGGALQVPGASAVVARYLGWQVQGYERSELITPFGIALS